MFIHEVDEEISMRMLSARDAEDLFQMTDRSRDYLREWLPWLDQIKSAEDSLQFIMNSFQIYAERTGLTSGVFYKDELVGIAGFNKFDWANRVGFVGYWLAEDHQGHGIMTRAVQGLIDYSFDQFDLNRIDIRTAYENKKSQAIPERLGFKNEGILRQAEWLYDRYVDHVVYGLLKSEWKGSVK